MQTIRQILDFYIFSNIHVALGVCCFVKVTLASFGVEENSTSFFVFFATVLSYNFIRLLNIPKRKNWVANWFIENRILLLILSFFCAFGCLYFIVEFKLNSILLLIPFVILTFFYGMKLPRSMISLRRIPGLKIFLIAFCWAGITVLFPLIENNVEITLKVWMLFLQRLLFVVLITIPFDIRDVEFDSETLKTIPQYFGVNMAKFIGGFAGFLIVFLELSFELGSTSVTLIILSLAVFMLLISSKNQSKYYSAFWVEAIPIVWFSLLIILG